MEVKLKPPEWDLGNIYIGISDPKIGSDLKVISLLRLVMNNYVYLYTSCILYKI